MDSSGFRMCIVCLELKLEFSIICRENQQNKIEV